MERIIDRAGVDSWPKLFQFLRLSRATELAAEHPAHVAVDWMGRSTWVAQKHYWQTSDADFDRALKPTNQALQNPVQLRAAAGCDALRAAFADTGIAGECETARS